MHRIEKVMEKLKEWISNKDVLEVACGSAIFSIFASEFAKNVYCIDLVNYRLDANIAKCDNLVFQIMDAAKMSYQDQTFDIIVLFNAIAHISDKFEFVFNECLRVLRRGGRLCIISSFKMDKVIIYNELIPRLQDRFNFLIEKDAYYTYLTIIK